MIVRALKGDHGKFQTPSPVETSRQAKEAALKNHAGFKGLTRGDLIARKLPAKVDEGGPAKKAGKPKQVVKMPSQQNEKNALLELDAVVDLLTKPGVLDGPYDNEDAYEAAVWELLRNGCKDLWPKWNADDADLLTSHTKRIGRSERHWADFHHGKVGAGPDVMALGSSNRVDIVLRTPCGGMIGIEVESCGPKRHTNHLVSGLGQAALTLAVRDWGLLAIHCGKKVDSATRRELRDTAARICKNSRLRIVVTPNS
jgi:hypothetical protein